MNLHVKAGARRDAAPAWTGFREAAIFTAVIIIAGFFLGWVTGGGGIPVPRWPSNLFFLAALAALTATLGLGFRNDPVVSWLGGIPVGLCLILGLAVLSFFGGVLPQDPAPPASMVAKLRLNGIFSSWPFALVSFLFLLNLGLSVVWKTVPFRAGNLQFILFHGGFWIALACGLLGSADLQRLIVPVREGGEIASGYDRLRDAAVPLPFRIRLNDFDIEEYVPQLYLFDPVGDRIVPERMNRIPEIRKGATAVWPGLARVEVLDYLPHAIPGRDGVPVPSGRKEDVAFAKLNVTAGGTTIRKWVSSGGPHVPPQFIVLGGHVLVMADGPPKVFRSNVTISNEAGERRNALLEVNRPFGFDGWQLYQIGYDEKSGRWSDLSVLEAVRDPWLPAVYTGFFMIMAGNLLFFWKGMKKMEEE